MVVTLGARVMLTLGTLATAADAPAAASGDQGSLYIAISTVIVALIGGAVLIYTSRRNQPAVPFVVDDSAIHELTDLYQQAEQRAARCEARAEMWKARAEQAGWGKGK